jgi:fatty acid desaturase
MSKKKERDINIKVNRLIIVSLIGSSFSLYFWTPSGIWWGLDIAVRTYILFLCGVMGHEASHSCLANSKEGNIWWGRLSFIPLVVPNVQFRITHRYHHSFTNEERDPDIILKIEHWWQFPARALAMPHHWVRWLKKNNLLTRKVLIEWLLTYIAFFLIYGSLALYVGHERILLGLIPAQVLNSFILWYPFAVKTHEGHHTGKQEFRSHDYYGNVMYWLTLGLSLHRAHHMYPHLGWLQLRPFIRKGPIFKRHIYET